MPAVATIAPPYTNKEPAIRARLRLFFERRPNKRLHVSRDVETHFTDASHPLIAYHMKHLIDEGFLTRVSRGMYELNPAYKSVEQVRAEVAAHQLANPPPIIQSGAPFDVKTPALQQVENPRVIVYLGDLFGRAVLKRMRAAGFVDEEVTFIESLLKKEYPATPELVEAVANGKR